MSAAAAEVQAALVTALAVVAGQSGVYDAAPARAAFPYLTIGEATSLDWSHKTARGREHRVAVVAWDEAGRAARLQTTIGAVEAAIEAMARRLPAHRIVSLVFLRSRIARGETRGRGWWNIGCGPWRGEPGEAAVEAASPRPLSLPFPTAGGRLFRRWTWRRRRDRRSC